MSKHLDRPRPLPRESRQGPAGALQPARPGQHVPPPELIEIHADVAAADPPAPTPPPSPNRPVPLSAPNPHKTIRIAANWALNRKKMSKSTRTAPTRTRWSAITLTTSAPTTKPCMNWSGSSKPALPTMSRRRGSSKSTPTSTSAVAPSPCHPLSPSSSQPAARRSLAGRGCRLFEAWRKHLFLVDRGIWLCSTTALFTLRIRKMKTLLSLFFHGTPKTGVPAGLVRAPVGFPGTLPPCHGSLASPTPSGYFGSRPDTWGSRFASTPGYHPQRRWRRFRLGRRLLPRRGWRDSRAGPAPAFHDAMGVVSAMGRRRFSGTAVGASP
jgi:hypothetical protein